MTTKGFLPGEKMADSTQQTSQAKQIKALEAQVAAFQQKEQTLLASVQKFQTLYERAPLGYQSLDAAGHFLEVNQTWLDTLGYERQEVVGRSFADFLTPASQERFRRQFPMFLADGQIKGVEFTMLRNDGTPLPVSFDGSISRDPAGQFQQTHCLFRELRPEEQVTGGVSGSRDGEILKNILDSLPHPFYVISAHDYTIRIANRAALKGAPLENLHCYTLTHHRQSPCMSQEHPCTLALVKKTGKPAIVEHIHFDAENNQRNMEVHGFPIYNPAGELIEMIEYSIDITKRKEAERKLAHLATHDVLTGLPNRALFNIRLELEMVHASRNKQKIAVMLLDLDRFKQVNDTLGHGVGDRLLQAVAGILQKQTRKSDTIARLGGDEFLVLLPEVDDGEAVEGVACNLLAALTRPIHLEDREVQIKASLGFALFPDDGKDGETLIRLADTAMYQAKASGGGIFRMYAEREGTEGHKTLVPLPPIP